MKSAATIFTLCFAAAALFAAEPASGPITLGEHIQPLLKQYCVDCHNADKHKGDLNLLPLLEKPNLSEHREVWEKIAEALESGDMPPEKKPHPEKEQREMLLNFIDG